MRCPFYGRHAALLPGTPAGGLLVDSGGNQCALKTSAYSPCILEIDGRDPILEDCPRNGCGTAITFARFPVMPPPASANYPD